MNGKGSRARNNFSKEFRDNFDSIQWGSSPTSHLKRIADSTKGFLELNGDALFQDERKCNKGHTLHFGTCYECKLEPGACGCRKCNPYANWFIVCEKCGNKRCPHATNHELNCTNSNAPGQKGSVFE